MQWFGRTPHGKESRCFVKSYRSGLEKPMLRGREQEKRKPRGSKKDVGGVTDRESSPIEYGGCCDDEDKESFEMWYEKEGPKLEDSIAPRD